MTTGQFLALTGLIREMKTVPGCELRVASSELRVPSCEFRVPSSQFRVLSSQYRPPALPRLLVAFFCLVPCLLCLVAFCLFALLPRCLVLSLLLLMRYTIFYRNIATSGSPLRLHTSYTIAKITGFFYPFVQVYPHLPQMKA